MKITIIGAAGGIGQSLSLLLKLNLPPEAELCLYDISPSALGVAIDLEHIPSYATVSAYFGDDIDQALNNSDIVLVTAGVPRKPGMTRADLFQINAGIVAGIMDKIAVTCPEAFIAIVTNPVNSILPVAVNTLKSKGVFNQKKLFGVTTLDSVRSESFVASLKGIDYKKLKITVIGGHSAETMLPIFSEMKDVELTNAEQEILINEVKNAGTNVVNAKNGNGSATLSMAYSAARFTDSLVKALSGEYIVENAYCYSEYKNLTFFNRPILLDKDGIKEILPIPQLDEFEQAELEKMVIQLEQDIELGNAFNQVDQ